MPLVRLAFMTILLLLAACGGNNGRGKGNGGGRDNDDGGGRDQSDVGDGRDDTDTTTYTCYDAGYADCYYYIDPDPSWWGCNGNAAADDYWYGYCDCEYDFGDTYWCATTYYTTY